MRSHAKASSAIAAIGCAIVLVCAFASPALAAKGVVGFFGEAGVQGGQFNNPGGAAVNLNGTGGATAGDVYVVDRGNNRVQQFHADGTWVRAFGLNVGGAGVNVCEVKASCVKPANSPAAGGMNAPQGVAIEQSTGLVYVTDQGNRRVDVFSTAGVFQGAFGWKVNSAAAAEELQLCTSSCQAGAINLGAGGFGVSDTGYPAIDPSNGHVLVPHKLNGRVDEFAPTVTAGAITAISFVSAFGWNVNKEAPAEAFQACTVATGCQAGTSGSGLGQFATGGPTSVAADANGRIYALDAFNNRVQAFSSAPAPEGVFAESRVSGEPRAISLAVDPTTNHLFVTKPCTTAACPGAPSGEHRVLELDSTGNLIESQAAKAGIPSSTGLGLGASGRTYMTTKEGGPSGKPGFFIIDALVPPQVTVEPVSTFTGTTATFEGHVTTDTIGATYHFEYSADGTNWTQLSEGTVPANSSSLAVSKSATGLEAHTEYQVRLIAVKQYAGGSASAQTSFTTGAAPPIIESVSRSHVRDTTALLEATINPENEDTEYSFEYTDEATYDAEGFASATSVPAPPGHVNGGSKAVSEQLAGLEPQTTYVYRLLASNETGDDESSVGAFTTHATPQGFEACPNDQFRINRPSEELPDCRAYEQASPVTKNGGNIQSEFTLTKASPSGDRISFLVLAGLPGGDGAQAPPTYIATRGGGKWTTQGLLPAAYSGEQARLLGWTPDFDQAFSATRKLGTGTSIVSRSSEGGALSTVAPYNTSLEGYGNNADYVGASADGSVALFQTGAELPVAPESHPPAAELSTEGVRPENLYAWNRDTGDLYFAGVLPDGSTAAKGAQAGIAGREAYRIDSHAVAGDGSVYFTDQQTGQLYRRFNPAAPETTAKDSHGDCIPDPVLACTVHISASEKYDGKGLEKHDAAGAQATKFMAASTDGTKAIFTSSEKLTTDAYTGPEPEPAAIARANSADGGGQNLSWLPTAADQIAVDPVAGYVYWTDPANERIGRAKLDGSGIEPNLITGLANLKGLTVVDEPGSEYVFWTTPAVGEDTEEGSHESEFEITGEGMIGRAGLDGSSTEPDCLEGITNPFRIDANSEHIYWTVPGRTFGERALGDGHVALAAFDCDEGTVEVRANEDWASGDLAVSENDIYTSDFLAGLDSSFVRRASMDGTEVQLLATIEETPREASVAIDGAHVYWTDYRHNEINRSGLDGLSPEMSFIAEANHPQGLGVDSAHLFWSAGQEQVPNPGSDIYAYDSKAPAGHRLADLAPEHDGDDGIAVQGVLGASADASYVYFVANGVPDGPVENSPNANGEEAEAGDCSGAPDFAPSGTCNLYLVHERQVTFIARLNAKNSPSSGEKTSDAANWVASSNELELTLISEKTARVSTDGKTLLFRSQHQLTGYDNQGPECLASEATSGGPAPGPCPELYRYHVGEPGLVCISCNPTGAPPVGPATLAHITVGDFTPKRPAPQLSRNLSADGDHIFFETPDQLVAGDTNGDETCKFDNSYRYPSRSCQDAYEWEASGTGSCPEGVGQEGCIYLLSTGKSPRPSFFGDASLTGGDAFIFTFSKLVRQDEDDQLDVYDASVGGGLASQDELPPVPCEGEACRGGVGPPPQSSSAGTQSFSAPGNPSPVHKKARKRKRRRRGHHAKNRGHSKQRNNRAAKSSGRTSR